MTEPLYIVVRATEDRGQLHALLPAQRPAVHSALDVAQREAERLAKENPSERFYVFGSVGFARAPRPVHWHAHDFQPRDVMLSQNPDDEIPF